MDKFPLSSLGEPMGSVISYPTKDLFEALAARGAVQPSTQPTGGAQRRRLLDMILKSETSRKPDPRKEK